MREHQFRIPVGLTVAIEPDYPIVNDEYGDDTTQLYHVTEYNEQRICDTSFSNNNYSPITGLLINHAKTIIVNNANCII